jgi:multidrug resistance efflux pump
VRGGNYANTGQRQMSVIDADSYWISGYFEETRLGNIHIGATARAELMGYPGVKVLGHVESINRGIADANTAPDAEGLPEVNPVFTWVRFAQRIPVRIHIDHVPDGVHLAIGETCTIYVDRPQH